MPAGCLELPQRLARQLRSSSITRRLKRKAFSFERRAPPSEGARDAPPESSAPARTPPGRSTRRQRTLLDGVLKSLDAGQLEALDEAVRFGGSVRTGCVLVDCADDGGPSAGAGNELCWLCCRAWRWPELPERAELRPLPLCAPPPDKSCRCVNPYHWSRVLRGAGLPVRGPQTRHIDELAVSEYIADCAGAYADLLSSTTSSTTEQDDSWCQVAYWELSQRIGPLFRVTSNSIDVFHDNPLHGCGGLSLQALWDAANHQRHYPSVDVDEIQQRSHHPDEYVNSSSERRNQLRMRIGLGLSLQRSPLGGVWVYNQSELAVFIGSRFLDRTFAEASTNLKGTKDGCSVLKLPPGCCAQVYDFGEEHNNARFSERLADDIYVGPSDQHSVHLSFGKGWGPGYTRQAITACSCWLEILMND